MQRLIYLHLNFVCILFGCSQLLQTIMYLDSCTHTGDDDCVVEHTLSIYLQPGSSGGLHAASLQPPSVDISADLECARFIGGSLSLLVAGVRGRLRDHYWRQALIDGQL